MTIKNEFAFLLPPTSNRPTCFLQAPGGEYLRVDFDGTRRMVRDRREATKFWIDETTAWIAAIPSLEVLSTGHNRF